MELNLNFGFIYIYICLVEILLARFAEIESTFLSTNNDGIFGVIVSISQGGLHKKEN